VQLRTWHMSSLASRLLEKSASATKALLDELDEAALGRADREAYKTARAGLAEKFTEERARENVAKMLEARGYEVFPSEAPEFEARRDEEVLLVVRRAKFGVADARVLVERFQAGEFAKVLVLADSPASAQAEEYLRLLNADYFLASRMQIDIMSARDAQGALIVPQHVFLSPEDARSVLKELQKKPEQMPAMFCDDPVARYYDARPGALAKIISRSEFAGSRATYRVVVAQRGSEGGRNVQQ